MALLLTATSVLALLGGPRVAGAFDGDIISDIEVGSLDEGRALEIKSEQFWRPVLQAAKRPELQGHAALYADAEAAIAGLGPEHAYVRSALGEALERLRRADEAVLAQAQQHEELAADQLARPPTGAGSWAWGGGGGSVPLLTGGRGFVSWAVQRFTDFGGYFKRLRGHVAERLANVTPALRGAAASARDVLGDCRVASGRAFDVLKYDIYERDVAARPLPSCVSSRRSRTVLRRMPRASTTAPPPRSRTRSSRTWIPSHSIAPTSSSSASELPLAGCDWQLSWRWLPPVDCHISWLALGLSALAQPLLAAVVLAILGYVQTTAGCNVMLVLG